LIKTRKRHGWALAAALLALVFAAPALSAPVEQQSAPPGAVFALAGTVHLWIADETGELHWGGDTRALMGRNVNWADRREVTLSQLQSFRRGDPWLSAGLLKQGDPIYLVKWETSQERPTLLHIQSIADVELFGINASNYGRFVLDEVAWQQRFGIPVSSLTKGVLQPAVVVPTATPAVTATPTPSPLTVREIAYGHDADTGTITNELEVRGAPPGRRLTVEATYTECTNADCSSTQSGKWGPLDAGPADADGRLRWIDRHGYYTAYTYTFTDVNGAKVSWTGPNDRVRTGLQAG
jgi:hypothetical protein